MTTTIEFMGGVGINGWYRVIRDGKTVATIVRNANRGWLLKSIHYRENLKGFRDIESARIGAVAYPAYPTKTEVYEAICARVENMRRRWKTANMATAMAEAARDLANGSNSAQNRLIEIAREIEAYAKDRSDIGNTQYLDGMRWHNGDAYLGHGPDYPDPPANTNVVSAA